MREDEIFCVKCERFTLCDILPQESSVVERVKLATQGLAWVRRRRHCCECGTQFWAGEVDEALIKQLASQIAKANSDSSRDLFSSLFEDPQTQDINGVTLELACGLVRASAWWNHPTKKEYVRAPGHAKNVRNSECGWLIQFGANTFFVGRAIKRSAEVLTECKRRIFNREDITGKDIVGQLERPLSTSVGNLGGTFYESYPIFLGKLRFGSAAIDIRDAAIYLMKHMGVHELLPPSSRPYSIY